jgi:hypothetical protein
LFLIQKNGGNMSITFDQGMLGFRDFAKDVKMETVVGKVHIKVPIYVHLSRSGNILVN